VSTVFRSSYSDSKRNEKVVIPHIDVSECAIRLVYCITRSSERTALREERNARRYFRRSRPADNYLRHFSGYSASELIATGTLLQFDDHR
jgi:hypothetical protein